MNRQTADFLNYLRYERNYSSQTIISYSRDIDKFFRFLSEEGLDMEEVDQIVIRNFLTDELNSGVSKRSCKRRLCALRHFYKYMVRREMVKDNPFVFVSSPKTEKTLPKFLYKDQVREILDENKKRDDLLAYRDQAILSTLYYSGIRASELVSLELQSVSLPRRTLRVLGKGNKERIVPISEECKKDIETYMKTTRMELASRNKEGTKVLFLNDHGNKLTTRGLEYILDQIEQKTGSFVGLHPHILRHSFILQFLVYAQTCSFLSEVFLNVMNSRLLVDIQHSW